MNTSASDRPIVVGVEDKEHSADAIALADLLAESLGAPLLLVHTHPSEDLSRVLDQGEYEQIVHSTLDSTFFEVQALVAGNRGREMRVMPASSPAAGLQEIAERQAARLIVVGPSHRSALGRVQPGSVGERLLSGAPAPVAIAPRGYANSVRRLEQVATAFDGSPESSQALEWAASVAQSPETRLRVVSVHAPIAFRHVSAGGAFAGESVSRAMRRELVQQHAAAIAAHGDSADGILRDGDPATVLVDASRDADILVLGSRGYGPLRAVLLGSVSQAVIRRATCPIVVVPRSAAREHELRSWASPLGDSLTQETSEPVHATAALTHSG
jgi:nucleotide-binding universal stress UspA family protein